MKLKDKSFEDMIVGAEKEMEFSIDTDNHLIFEILRDKMYKDKIGSICREVISNCRDANREAGSTEPVLVSIIEPNKVVYVGHQSISFRDSGLGITPDRMADIYVKYAASTKRDTNGQTGGFGLGAKTPFAYNDTFTVITVCDHDGKRMKYFYTALIDKSRKGKMVLFDTQEVDEETGTEVIVPIKTPEDREKFERESLYYTKSWGDEVMFNNFKRERSTFNTIWEEDGYMFVNTDDRSNYSMIIDGIPYPLDKDIIKKTKNGVPSFGEYVQCVLLFNTGDLTISANRESVQYDDDTILAINDKIDLIREDMSVYLDTHIESIPTYIEACKFHYHANGYGSLRSHESFENKLEYLLLCAVRKHDYRSYGVLYDDYQSQSKEWNGKKLVDRVSLKHHNLILVRRKPQNSWETRRKVYNKESAMMMSEQHTKLPIYYGDINKSNRRNLTIWNESDEFWLITPIENSTELDKTNELANFSFELGFTFEMYSDVTPTKIQRGTGEYSYEKKDRVRVSCRKYCGNSYGYSEEIYADRESGDLFWDSSATKPVDLTETCAVVVESLSDWNYSISAEHENQIRTVYKEKTVLIINEKSWKARVESTGMKQARDLFKKIYNKNIAKWTKEGHAYIVASSIPSKVLEYMDSIPQVLPKYVVENFNKEDLQKALTFSESYNKAKGKIKFDGEGLRNKIDKKLQKKYPLLEYCLDNWRLKSEKKRDMAVKYVKQVEYYETKN